MHVQAKCCSCIPCPSTGSTSSTCLWTSASPSMCSMDCVQLHNLVQVGAHMGTLPTVLQHSRQIQICSSGDHKIVHFLLPQMLCMLFSSHSFLSLPPLHSPQADPIFLCMRPLGQEPWQVHLQTLGLDFPFFFFIVCSSSLSSPSAEPLTFFQRLAHCFFFKGLLTATS